MSPGPIAYAATKGVVDTLVKHFAAESGSALAACSSCAGELAAKHGHAALRLLSGGFVLKDIPVLYEHAIGNADDVGCDPVPWSPIARKSAVDDHEILIGENHTGFIPQRRRHAPDQTEQSLASRDHVDDRSAGCRQRRFRQLPFNLLRVGFLNAVRRPDTRMFEATDGLERVSGPSLIAQNDRFAVSVPGYDAPMKPGNVVDHGGRLLRVQRAA
jgi:hypothetical protein